MSRITWDQIGEKKYETGVDRGVLFLPDNSGVPWNGLTHIEETTSAVTTNSYYLDGVKYLDRRTSSDFAGVLKALSYPDEFLPFDGYIEYAGGLFFSDQQVMTSFGLSYRTLIGDDVDGLDRGYKVHLLYNLTATPDNKAYDTLSASPQAPEMSWTLTGIPIPIVGYRPTCHLVIDSTKATDDALLELENRLYGNVGVDPSFPLPADVIDIIVHTSAPDIVTEFILANF